LTTITEDHSTEKTWTRSMRAEPTIEYDSKAFDKNAIEAFNTTDYTL